jgi:hypothetical protein
MPSNDRITITAADLNSPSVEAFLQTQQAMHRDVGELAPQPLAIRVLYSSWFYLALTSGLGAFVAWMIVEPFINDEDLGRRASLLYLFVFPLVVGFIGLFLGASEGLMCRNLKRAVICGLVGFGIGFGVGIVFNVASNFLYAIIYGIAIGLANGQEPDHGFPLLIKMIGRSLAWAFMSIPAGLGQGIALKEKKIVINGIIGAVLGGLIGGLLFDPIYRIFSPADGEAWLSRMVGFVFIGVMVGLFTGLVEGWTKTAWLLMRAGPLSGKQFVIYRDITVLGSSPKAEIYLFKDEAIEPRHAVIYNRGGRFEIEDCNTRDGTYVNGVPIKRQIIQSGDQVVLGKTVLEFQLKESH